MVVAGFKSDEEVTGFRYVIVRPVDIECPESLVNVVVGWNIPMHVFLKTCNLFFSSAYIFY